MKPRTLLPGIALLGALALTACSTGTAVDLDGGGSGATGPVLTAAIAGEPDQLDPHKTSSYFAFEVLENVYDTLVAPDENLEMQPALAESWTLSDDQLTWTFSLRDGVEFHDGSPFSSADVVYSLNRIIDEELANAWRLSAVTSVTAPDDRTVAITVAQPTPNLLSSLGGFKGVAIVQQANVDSGDITTKPVGTGPFSLVKNTPGDAIELAANPDYWGGAPKLGGVTFTFLSEGNTAVAALKSGEVQWTDSIPTQQVAALQQDSALSMGVEPSTDYWYLAINQKHEPYGDARVRQAIGYAIDREAIAQVTSYGTAEVNQLAIPKQSTWYTKFDGYRTDLDRAKELMAEAGVDSLSLDLLATADYPETVTAAQVIADNLKPLGIEVSIRQPDFATWLDEQNSGNFDMLMMGWLGNIDPDDFYYAQHHTDGASNAQGYSNPKVDALLDAGRTELDAEKRQEIYVEAARIIAEDASYLYLYNPSVIQAWAPSVTGYEVRSDRAVRFSEVSLAE
ncbi:ABC transporter substrate-binding protein [Leucobacter sp. M11]|uniref:ABC transporter substrate-binding protein n=1 Tax=Leucobacter sp. M11 TaxID=2993565 RepID=UPI002D80D9D8|nr:ABC transporter substrate-binding protein [Leucobacter sp. M11]MEB4613603.1 ABC transporter substrate-binding protein [Leucobacter sp. M11]